MSGSSLAVAEPGSASVSGVITQVADGAEGVGSDLPELVFIRPMPGFPQLTRYALVRLDTPEDGGDAPDGAVDAEAEDAAEDPVLFELRCVQAPDVRFLVAAPVAFFPDYGFDLDDDVVAELGLAIADDALVLVVLTIGDDAASTTANLLAPVVVNVRTRMAAQVILSGTDWPVRAAVV